MRRCWTIGLRESMISLRVELGAFPRGKTVRTGGAGDWLAPKSLLEGEGLSVPG